MDSNFVVIIGNGLIQVHTKPMNHETKVIFSPQNVLSLYLFYILWINEYSVILIYYSNIVHSRFCLDSNSKQKYLIFCFITNKAVLFFS